LLAALKEGKKEGVAFLPFSFFSYTSPSYNFQCTSRTNSTGGKGGGEGGKRIFFLLFISARRGGAGGERERLTILGTDGNGKKVLPSSLLHSSPFLYFTNRGIGERKKKGGKKGKKKGTFFLSTLFWVWRSERRGKKLSSLL